MPNLSLQFAEAKEPSKSLSTSSFIPSLSKKIRMTVVFALILAIDEKFWDCVKFLAEELFSRKYLTAKMIGGCEVTGKDLFSFFIENLKNSIIFVSFLVAQ